MRYAGVEVQELESFNRIRSRTRSGYFLSDRNRSRSDFYTVFEILMSSTLRDLWQGLNRSRSQFLKDRIGVEVEKIRLLTPLWHTSCWFYVWFKPLRSLKILILTSLYGIQCWIYSMWSSALLPWDLSLVESNFRCCLQKLNN